MPVYAVIDGKPYIAAVSEETLRYQLSWTLPNAESSARDFEIAVYDEDGFGEYEKVRIASLKRFIVLIACFRPLKRAAAARQSRSSPSRTRIRA